MTLKKTLKRDKKRRFIMSFSNRVSNKSNTLLEKITLFETNMIRNNA